MKAVFKERVFSDFLVEHMTYKSSLIVIDLSSIHKYELKNDPSTLNISIKSVSVDDGDKNNN